MYTILNEPTTNSKIKEEKGKVKQFWNLEISHWLSRNVEL